MDILKQIMNDIDKWAEPVRIDENPNNNPLIDAYNEGVDALANKIKFYMSVIINANGGDE